MSPFLVPSLLRKSWSPNQSSLGAKRETLSPIFLKEDLQPLFQTWYEDASTKGNQNLCLRHFFTSSEIDQQNLLLRYFFSVEDSFLYQFGIKNCLLPCFAKERSNVSITGISIRSNSSVNCTSKLWKYYMEYLCVEYYSVRSYLNCLLNFR